VNTIVECESSAELAYAKKAVIVGQTNSLLATSAVLALVLGGVSSFLVAADNSQGNRIESGALPSTNTSPIDQELSDHTVAAELMRMFTELAARQVEMDDLSRSVLYKRMRDLYRR